jgi:hypothetical protein
MMPYVPPMPKILGLAEEPSQEKKRSSLFRPSMNDEVERFKTLTPNYVGNESYLKRNNFFSDFFLSLF